MNFNFPFARLLFFFIIHGLSSCSGQVVKIEIMVGDFPLRVEIADTPELRNQGLMNRKHLPENQGMLFVFDKEAKVSFWMKNTSIPLSLAYIASDGTIRQIVNLEPFSLSPVRSHRYVLYALEVNRDWFAQRDISVGDMVDLTNLPQLKRF